MNFVIDANTHLAFLYIAQCRPKIQNKFLNNFPKLSLTKIAQLV